MPEQSDRDILIEVRTQVTALHGELLGAPGREGRMPKLESTVEEHSTQINRASGSLSALIWIISGVGILAMAFGGVLLAHILGGK